MNSGRTQTSNQIDSYLDKSYKYGFITNLETEKSPKGLNEDTIKFISQKKKEPMWMLNWRLQAFERWKKMEEPSSVPSLSLFPSIKSFILSAPKAGVVQVSVPAPSVCSI